MLLIILLFICLQMCSLVNGTWELSGTACSASGDGTGVAMMDLGNNKPGTVITTDTYYLMVEKGIINCYGMVTSWRFFKTRNSDCDTMKFHVWRQKGATNEYLMVGENEYDPLNEECNRNDIGTIIYGITADKQIPVEPGDILGWSTSSTFNEMISNNDKKATTIHLTGTISGNPIPMPGTLFRYNDGNVTVDISLQAIITRAPLPLFSTLPREQKMRPGIDSRFQYRVQAVHSGNVMPQDANPATAMDDAVTLTYGLSNTCAFTIGTVSGWVKSIDTYDYEVGKVYELPVTVTAMALTSTATLTVTVMEYPGVLVAQQPNHVIEISANDKILHDEIYHTYIDNISSVNYNTLKFYMGSTYTSNPQGRPPPFYVDENTGVVHCSQNLSLFLPLDVPRLPQSIEYTFDVTVTDTVLYDIVQLTVRIINLRQRPSFRNANESINVMEDVPALTTIYRVLADSISPEGIVFSIESVSPASSRDSFEIDPTSGRVWVTENHGLLRETTCTLSLGVRDSVLSGFQCVLTINVKTTNQPPSFLSPDYYIRIAEKCDQDNGSHCDTLPWVINNFEINVLDRESVQFSCNRNPWQSHGSQYFSFTFNTPCDGVMGLAVVNTIDVDTDPSLHNITLTFSVSDRGFRPTKDAVGHVHVTVYDINDNIPQFTQPNYSISLNENMQADSILTVIATDFDLTSPNNRVTYSIAQTSNSILGRQHFEVNSRNGILKTKQPVDFEEHQIIEFEVIAQDGGTPPKENITTVTVHINDVNDVHPEYQCVGRALDDPYPPEQGCFYNLELRSDTEVGHEVLQLLATDNDTVTSQPSHFLLKPDNYFMLYSSGLLVTKRVLRNHDKQILCCYAEDEGVPNLLSQVQLVRIDSYPPKWHLVDITLEIPINEFRELLVQSSFFKELRDLLHPWHVKMENVKLYKQKTKVTIYALENNATYYIHNMRLEKKFVHRNMLLKRLRKNIHGTPHDDLLGPEFERFDPIRVMPTFPIWWTDTVEGIATICVICFLFTLQCVAISVFLCRRYGLLCFKNMPLNRDWQSMADKSHETKAHTETSTETSTGASTETSTEQMKLNYAVSGAGSMSLRQRTLPILPPVEQYVVPRSDSLSSLDTIHTNIYDHKK